MNKAKPFNITFVISFIWHVLVISAVTIVVTPHISKLRHYQEVSFLGPILEKTAFELMAGQPRQVSEVLYAHSPIAIGEFSLKVKGPARKIAGDVFPIFLEERFSFTLKDYFAGTKEVPGYFFEEKALPYVKTYPDQTEYVRLEGPAAFRKILYRPEPPKVSRLLYGGSREFIMKFKFYVSDEGRVESVEPAISSGIPEVDLIGIRYLKLWQFAPESILKGKKMQSGEMSLKLKAD